MTKEPIWALFHSVRNQLTTLAIVKLAKMVGIRTSRISEISNLHLYAMNATAIVTVAITSGLISIMAFLMLLQVL